MFKSNIPAAILYQVPNTPVSSCPDQQRFGLRQMQYRRDSCMALRPPRLCGGLSALLSQDAVTGTQRHFQSCLCSGLFQTGERVDLRESSYALEVFTITLAVLAGCAFSSNTKTNAIDIRSNHAQQSGIWAHADSAMGASSLANARRSRGD